MEFIELIAKLAFILMTTIAVVGWLIWLFNRKTEWQNTYQEKELSQEEKAKTFFRKNQEKNENKRKRSNDKFNLLVVVDKLKSPTSLITAIALSIIIYSPIMHQGQKIISYAINKKDDDNVIIKRGTGIKSPRQNVERITKDNTNTRKLEWSEGNENIYSWKDYSGVVHFNNQKMIAQKTLNNDETAETKVRIINNSILVPVAIENNGRQIQINMLLDTGCSQTLIHYSAVQLISPNIIGQVGTFIADGRMIPNSLVQVDAIKVGPFREENFVMQTTNVQNENLLPYNGLLGMAFLKKHPFQIDTQRQVIRWL